MSWFSIIFTHCRVYICMWNGTVDYSQGNRDLGPLAAGHDRCSTECMSTLLSYLLLYLLLFVCHNSIITSDIHSTVKNFGVSLQQYWCNFVPWPKLRFIRLFISPAGESLSLIPLGQPRLYQVSGWWQMVQSSSHPRKLKTTRTSITGLSSLTRVSPCTLKVTLSNVSFSDWPRVSTRKGVTANGLLVMDRASWVNVDEALPCVLWLYSYRHMRPLERYSSQA